MRCGHAHSTVLRAESSRSTASPIDRERRLQRRTRNRIGADAEAWLTEDDLEAVFDLARHFGFQVGQNASPAFAEVLRGRLRLLLAGPEQLGRPANARRGQDVGCPRCEQAWSAR